MASNVTGLLGEYETEEEIFAAIGLEYLPPELRNA
jgi:DNA polymerase/3'-5' exonuclease PolX